MKLHLYVPVYAATLLLSAALLFSVQPMFSKMILPLLGGTPQVWNTAMLFFQMSLLAGYAYAHGTTRLLGIRLQALVHLALLVLFAFVLPVAIPEGWTPPVNEDPALWQLSLMAVTVGGPFFVLSGSAPILQRWFTGTDHPDAGNPYFLYGASNLGSMTALLAYPVLFEPLMTLNEQSELWTYGYGLLTTLTVLCAILVWVTSERQVAQRIPANDETITWARRGQWLLLAFIPSSLMLGVTTYITTDVASVPLLWIIPLALYVSTFIIVFSRQAIISKSNVTMILGYLVIILLAQMLLFSPRSLFLIPFHMILFFFAALACHMELADSRPHARHLTEFYLIMSLGGALGGVFNALIAPNVFIIPLEYPLALGAATAMRYASKKAEKPDILYIGIAISAIVFVVIAFNVPFEEIKMLMAFLLVAALALVIDKRWLFAVPVTVALLLYPPGHVWGRFHFTNIIHQDRNFFGVLKVTDTKHNQRILLHGTTNHGTQALIEEYKMTPLSYYYESGSIGETFKALDKKPGPQKVAVLGLGVGVTACFSRQGRHFDFFEIDPQIIEIAQNPEYFTFLSDCGSPYTIIQGDARLTIAGQPDDHYDFILADAFSSDNIPVHILTREAVELYLKKLKPGGILAFNISNNYLDIEPVLAEIASALNMPAYARVSKGVKIGDSDLKSYTAHTLVFVQNENDRRFLEDRGWTPARHRTGVGLWTDQFSNIFSVMINKTGAGRSEELRQKARAERENTEKTE